MSKYLKNSIRLMFMLTVVILIGSCKKRHKYSAAFCNNNLYIETFTLSSGAYNDYLTDSVNFRIDIGRWDNEHENFIYSCIGDRISVVKIRKGSSNCRWIITPDGKKSIKCDVDTIEKHTYDIKILKNNLQKNSSI